MCPCGGWTWKAFHFDDYYFLFEEENHLLCGGSEESVFEKKEERTFAMVFRENGRES